MSMRSRRLYLVSVSLSEVWSGGKKEQADVCYPKYQEVLVYAPVTNTSFPLSLFFFGGRMGEPLMYRLYCHRRTTRVFFKRIQYVEMATVIHPGKATPAMDLILLGFNPSQNPSDFSSSSRIPPSSLILELSGSVKYTILSFRKP